jgi:beta-carotene ketolase (CrtW type)
MIKKYTGTFIATAIISLWFLAVGYALSQPFQWQNLWLILPIAFLYTGLFITAHDAMHGIVLRGQPAVNAFIGQLALGLFAMMSFRGLRRAHWDHHKYPGTDKDPDFYAGAFWPWYFAFMRQYIRWWQVLAVAAIFNVLHHALAVPLPGLLLFWVLPSLLSTLQLFYFGTYLPHKREQKMPFTDRHNARSNQYNVWWSFITCYHFGYHWEHHEYPSVPWWQLPKYVS